MRRIPRNPVAALAVVLVLVLSACGGGDDDATATTSTTENLDEIGAVEDPEGPRVLTGTEAAQHRDWLAAMTEMCEDNLTRLPPLPTEITAGSMREFFPGTIEFLEDRRSGFERIGPPLISVASYEDYLVNLDELVALVEEALLAARRGEEPELQELIDAIGPISVDNNFIAAMMGLDGCVTDYEDDPRAQEREPVAYGDDPQLDALWDACEAGDAPACDELGELAPRGSVYSEFATTCGGRFSLSAAPAQCEQDVATGDAETYGDDPDLDELWDACEAGDGVACDELFFASDPDTDYEAFAATCGRRFEREEVPLTCEVIADD